LAASSSFIWKDDFDSIAAYGHDDKSVQTERIPFFITNAAFSLLTTASDYWPAASSLGN